jgi:hypothetical protein
MRYTIDNYTSIVFSGINYKLPNIQISIIDKLVKELGISTIKVIEDENEETPRKSHQFSGKKFNSNSLSSSRYKSKIDETWKGVPEFKITKIEKSEGIDQIIKEIRVCLNKISNKNYHSQKEAIFNFINSVNNLHEKEGINNQKTKVNKEENKEIIKNKEVIKNKDKENNNIINPFGLLDEEDDEEDDEEEQHNEYNKIQDNNNNCSLDLKKVAQSIFDIASSNKFYSELYAELYQELINKYDYFKEYVTNLIEEYYKSMDLIVSVDPNKDYDKYCENNKQNDKRKALSTFIVNLMKKDVIAKKDVLNLIIKLQEKIMLFVDIDEKSNSIDEITENIYLLITMINLKELNCKDYTDKIIKNIEICSSYKVKEHKSISNRAIFKYMDILDSINKVK